jgi:hypothetical protein
LACVYDGLSRLGYGSISGNPAERSGSSKSNAPPSTNVSTLPFWSPQVPELSDHPIIGFDFGQDEFGIQNVIPTNQPSFQANTSFTNDVMVNNTVDEFDLGLAADFVYSDLHPSPQLSWEGPQYVNLIHTPHEVTHT